MSLMREIFGRIEEYFGFSRHRTSFRTETLGGVSTFLALSYIFVVNPAILGEGGMDKSTVFFATIIASFVATLAMGLWAKKPFVLAPGMEMNAYAAFFVIAGLGFTWQQALGAVFWSGIIYLALTFSRFREKIIEAIPDRMKSSLSLCVGIFLMLIALRIAGIIRYEGIVLAGLGAASPLALVMMLGLAIVFIANRLRLPGAVIISIILCSVAAYALGIGEVSKPIEVSEKMFTGLFQADLLVIMNPSALSVILVLFIVDFYGSIAKFIGLSRKTSIVSKNGSMRKMKEAMLVDGASNITGSVLGTTSIITYVESRIGIQEGARTGFAAVVCALLMLSMFLIAPLVSIIPLIATTGVLFWVGICLMPSRNDLKSYTRADIATLIVMSASVIATFAIDKALFFGFLAFIIATVVSGRRKEISIYMAISAAMLLLGIILTIIS